MLKKLKISGKRLRLCVALGLLCAVFLSLTDFNADCENIRECVAVTYNRKF